MKHSNTRKSSGNPRDLRTDQAHQQSGIGLQVLFFDSQAVNAGL